MSSFFTHVGQHLYDTLGSQKIAESFKSIFDNFPNLAFVHESVMKECEPERLLPMLILAPKLDSLLVPGFYPQGDEAQDLKVFEGLGHNIAHSYISEFISVLDITEMKVDFASHPDPDIVNIPLEKALFVAELMCISRDVAACCAHALRPRVHLRPEGRHHERPARRRGGA